jgi:DNA-binding NarL/FixJ family response regulator
MNPSFPKTDGKTRVLVADDHPLFREGLVGLINRQEDLACCGEADSGATTLQGLRELKPELVLLDLRLRHEDGIELIRTLKAECPQLRILVVSQCAEALYSERALRAGAHGYVMKEEAADEILTAIRCVQAGELFVSRKMAANVVRKYLEPKPRSPRTGVEVLSDRELQVFGMIGDGLSSRQVATHLNLSVKTVETHRENIKHKLGLRAAADLIREAARWQQSQSAPQSATRQVPGPGCVRGRFGEGLPGVEGARDSSLQSVGGLA